MKIKEGFMLREIAGQAIVVPLGSRVVEISGIISLSESGALLWRELVNGADTESLVECLLREYDVDEETARNDVKEFIDSVKEKDLLDD